MSRSSVQPEVPEAEAHYFIPEATREPVSAVKIDLPTTTDADDGDIFTRFNRNNVDNVLKEVQKTHEIDNSEQNTNGFKENFWKTLQDNMNNCNNYWFKNDPEKCINTRTLLNYPGRTNKRKGQKIYSVDFRNNPLHAGSRKRRRRRRKHTLKR